MSRHQEIDWESVERYHRETAHNISNVQNTLHQLFEDVLQNTVHSPLHLGWLWEEEHNWMWEKVEQSVRSQMYANIRKEAEKLHVQMLSALDGLTRAAIALQMIEYDQVSHTLTFPELGSEDDTRAKALASLILNQHRLLSDPDRYRTCCFAPILCLRDFPDATE